MRLFWFMLLITSTLLSSCGDKKEEPQVAAPKAPRKLKTDFLKMGKPGEVKGQSDFISPADVVVLGDDQKIHLIDEATGEISIDNFDANDLIVGKIIIGNEEDRLLLKVTELKQQSAQPTQIFIRKATVAELAGGEDASIAFTASPKVDFNATDNASVEILPRPQQGTSNIKFSSTQSVQDDQAKLGGNFNVVEFKDYEILNITGQALLLGNGIKDGDKKNYHLNTNGNAKVTIKEGSVQFIPTFRGDFKFKRGKVRKLMTSIDALVKYRFNIEVESTSALTGEFSFPLFKDIKFPVRIPGTPPVYIDIVIDFPAGLKLNWTKKGKSSFTIESEYAFSAQSFYTPEAGSDYKAYSDYLVRQRDLKQTSETDLTFELFFEPKVQTRIYKVLGPYVYMHSGLQAHLQYPLMPSKKDLTFNFHGGIGAQVIVPIWDLEIFDAKSPVLFNVSRSWDILGPKKGGKTTQGSAKGEVTLQIDKLAPDGSVPLRLLPTDADPMTKVRVYANPQYGKLVLDEKFNLNSMVYYYPPKNVEGQDSFQIQFTHEGTPSKPTRLIFSLGQEAQRQAKEMDYTTHRTAYTPQSDVTYSLPPNVYEKPVTTSIAAEKGHGGPGNFPPGIPGPPSFATHYLSYPMAWLGKYPEQAGQQMGNCSVASSQFKIGKQRAAFIPQSTKEIFDENIRYQIFKYLNHSESVEDIRSSIALIENKKIRIYTLFDERELVKNVGSPRHYFDRYHAPIPGSALLNNSFNPIMPMKREIEEALQHFAYHEIIFECPKMNTGLHHNPDPIERIMGKDIIFTDLDALDLFRFPRL